MAVAALVLIGGPRADVRAEYKQLPAVETSLSDGNRDGKMTFAAMGFDRAYTGAPAEATREEGEASLDKLAEMITTDVAEAMGVGP